jgi:hypothetical protein
VKLKHNLILFIVLIIFASVILLFERPFENKAKKTREEAPPLFPGLKVEQVKKIVVKKSNAITTLENRDNLWCILDKEDYPADPAIVEGVIKKIQGFKKINLASRKKDKHSLFEVKEGMGVEVTLLGSEKKELARFLIGKNGPDFLSTYVRKADSDDVYLYDDYLKGDFDKQVNNWRDKTIVAFNPSEVVTLTISKLKEKETIALTKDTQGNWQLEEPMSGLAENSPIEKILTTLGNLKAADFADEEKELKDSGIDNPTYQIAVRLKDNRKKTLLVGNAKERGQYYAKNDEKKYLFLLDHTTVENLVPKVKDLQKTKTGAEEKKPPENTEPTPSPLRRNKL